MHYIVSRLNGENQSILNESLLRCVLADGKQSRLLADLSLKWNSSEAAQGDQHQPQLSVEPIWNMERLNDERNDPAGDDPDRKILARFDERFADEAACKEFLRKVRWPRGIVCPACRRRLKGLTGAMVSRRCGRCNRRVHMAADTWLEGSRIPLRVWFRVAWMIAFRVVVKVTDLISKLGLSRYATAWRVRHEIYRACALSRRKLRGVVGIGVFVPEGWDSGFWFAVEVWWHAPGHMCLSVQPRELKTSLRSFLLRHLDRESVEGLVLCGMPEFLEAIAVRLGHKMITEEERVNTVRTVVKGAIRTLQRRFTNAPFRVHAREVRNVLAVYSYWYDRRRVRRRAEEDLLHLLCRPTLSWRQGKSD